MDWTAGKIGRQIEKRWNILLPRSQGSKILISKLSKILLL